MSGFEVCVVADALTLAEVAARRAAAVIQEAVADGGHASVMLASGNSQRDFLEFLTADPAIAWSHVVGFHMDEYLGIDETHPASFRRYMREQIVEVAHPAEFHEIRGDAPDASAECERYAELLHRNPLDLCCLGIGENGHLAFNDPPVADFDDPADVKIVELDEACRRQQVGEGHFADLGAVPTRAITVTIPALLRAREVLAIVPEARKAEPVRRALSGPIGTACPASILRTRPNVSLFLDADSSALVASP